MILQLNEKGEDLVEEHEEEDPSEIESLLLRTADAINQFKSRLEDERDRTAVEEAKQARRLLGSMTRHIHPLQLVTGVRRETQKERGGIRNEGGRGRKQDGGISGRDPRERHRPPAVQERNARAESLPAARD